MNGMLMIIIELQFSHKLHEVYFLAYFAQYYQISFFDDDCWRQVRSSGA